MSRYHRVSPSGSWDLTTTASALFADVGDLTMHRILDNFEDSQTWRLAQGGRAPKQNWKLKHEVETPSLAGETKI